LDTQDSTPKASGGEEPYGGRAFFRLLRRISNFAFVMGSGCNCHAVVFCSDEFISTAIIETVQ
jgi:hypothetical protein